MAKRGQGTLEVKFQPVGDRKLILVLKAMQKQMSKIERRFQGVNSETKTTGVAMDGFFKKLGMGQTTVRNSNKGFIGLGNTFSVLRSKMLLAGFAMTILGKTVGTAMNKFFEQEKALMKLKTIIYFLLFYFRLKSRILFLDGNFILTDLFCRVLL